MFRRLLIIQISFSQISEESLARCQISKIGVFGKNDKCVIAKTENR